MNVSNGAGRNRGGRKSRNTITTKSGKTLKIHNSLSDRAKARKQAEAAEKALYLSTLPKNKFKRVLVRMHPKRVFKYWFSRQGGIMALKLVGIAIIASFFLTIGLFAYFRKDLPKIKDISGDSLGGSITYYDRTGQTVLWQDYDGVKRTPVQGNEISPYLKNATVAIEDKGFYKEGAFDVRGILRAGVHDAVGAGGTQGGSTITQQLVKLNEGWTDNRTVTRKVKELILATELEREYSKDDILTGYLNIAPYGGVEYGAEAAAQDYFGVSAKDLTLAQASMLAAIPQSPSYYSPYSSQKYNQAVTEDSFSAPALIGRQQYILEQMANQGYITHAQEAAAEKVDILAQVKQLTSSDTNIKAPYFVQAAKQELINKYGSTIVNRGGWKVVTTLDMNLQTHAEQLVASNYTNIQKRTAGLADDEANVTEDVQTGQIVEMVGGVGYNDPNSTYGKLNFGASQLISPGSSFKPYDYATLINDNNNVGAGSVLYDTQGALPANGYECTNKALPKNGGNCLEDYDFIYPGPITLRYALGGSRNVPAVKAMLEAVPNDTSNGKLTSVNKVISTASAMMDNPYLQAQKQKTYNCYEQGVDVNTATPDEETQCGPSSAIGDGAYVHLDDHVNGLSTLARLGQAIPRTYLLKITDASNQVIYQWKQPKPTQAVRTDAAYIVDNMASDPNASYLPGSCTATSCTSLAQGGYKFQRYNGWTFAVKTGTTNYGFDGLMASWSNKYATVSWVGNHTRNVDITSKTGTSMEYLTEPLTRGMIEYAHQGLKPDNWVQPSDIKTAPAFVQRTHIHYGDVEPGPTNDLFPSWYVGGTNSKATSQTTDKVSGKLATSCTPADAKSTETNSNVAFWNVDIFNGGKSSIGTVATNAATTTASASDDVHNCSDSPPTVTLTAPSSCDTSCTITATVTQGTHPLTDPARSQFPGTIDFTLNGQTINTQPVSDSPSTVSFTYTPTSSGSGTLTATVTDSVLYQGNQSVSFAYTVPTPAAAASPLTITTPANNASVTGSSLNVAWAGGNGTYLVYLNGSPVSNCQNITATACTVALPAAIGSDTVTVNDTGGNQANATILHTHS